MGGKAQVTESPCRKFPVCLGVGEGVNVGAGAGVVVAVAVGVSVDGVVAVGCCCRVVGAGCAGADAVDSGVAGGGVAVTTTVTTWDASLPQAASVIARAINAASIRVILNIIGIALLIQLRGALRVGEGVVVAEGPVDGFDQGAAVGGAAEAVVAVGDGAAHH